MPSVLTGWLERGAPGRRRGLCGLRWLGHSHRLGPRSGGRMAPRLDPGGQHLLEGLALRRLRGLQLQLRGREGLGLRVRVAELLVRGRRRLRLLERLSVQGVLLLVLVLVLPGLVGPGWRRGAVLVERLAAELARGRRLALQQVQLGGRGRDRLPQRQPLLAPRPRVEAGRSVRPLGFPHRCHLLLGAWDSPKGDCEHAQSYTRHTEIAMHMFFECEYRSGRILQRQK